MEVAKECFVFFFLMHLTSQEFLDGIYVELLGHRANNRVTFPSILEEHNHRNSFDIVFVSHHGILVSVKHEALELPLILCGYLIDYPMNHLAGPTPTSIELY